MIRCPVCHFNSQLEKGNRVQKEAAGEGEQPVSEVDGYHTRSQSEREAETRGAATAAPGSGDNQNQNQNRLSANMTRSASFGDKLKSGQNSLDRRAGRSRPLASSARDDVKATSAFNLVDRDAAAARHAAQHQFGTHLSVQSIPDILYCHIVNVRCC